MDTEVHDSEGTIGQHEGLATTVGCSLIMSPKTVVYPTKSMAALIESIFLTVFIGTVVFYISRTDTRTP